MKHTLKAKGKYTLKTIKYFLKNTEEKNEAYTIWLLNLTEPKRSCRWDFSWARDQVRIPVSLDSPWFSVFIPDWEKKESARPWTEEFRVCCSRWWKEYQVFTCTLLCFKQILLSQYIRWRQWMCKFFHQHCMAWIHSVKHMKLSAEYLTSTGPKWNTSLGFICSSFWELEVHSRWSEIPEQAENTEISSYSHIANTIWLSSLL